MGVSVPYPSLILLDTAIAAVTTLDIPNLAGFRQISITGTGLTVSAAAGLEARTSIDNGATFINAAGSYQWNYTGASAAGSPSDTEMQFNPLTLATAKAFILDILNLNNANAETIMRCNTLHADTFSYIGIGRRLAATAENAVQLRFSGGGNTSGRIVVEGFY